MNVELKEQPMIAYNTFKDSEEAQMDNSIPRGAHVPPIPGEYSYFIYVPISLTRNEEARNEEENQPLAFDKWIIETVKSKHLTFQMICHYSLPIDVSDTRRPKNHLSHGKILEIVKKIDHIGNIDHETG